MPTFRRGPKGTPAPTPATSPTGSTAPRWPDDMRGLAAALAAVFEGHVTDTDHRIRVEDLLSAASAVCGEACMAAAGEVDPTDHAFVPGSPVLSDRVNAILAADASVWSAAGQSVFGVIRAGAIASGYAAEEIPALDEPFRLFAASIAGTGVGPIDGPGEGWGYVMLSVPADNRPRIQPLRQAYELRGPVRALLAERAVAIPDWPAACALALVVELGRVRDAIDHGIAMRIVLETVNGMAKLAPMTDRHFREMGTPAT